MREAFNNTCIKVQSNPRDIHNNNNTQQEHRVHSFSIIAQYGSVVILATQRSHLADGGDTHRSNVSVGGTQGLPSLWKTGASVYCLHPADSCTTEQATCDVKDNTLIFALKTRALTL